MATKHEGTIKFVPMTTINKKTTGWETDCADWVATEKIHGSSFQFFTNNGEKVYLASRRTLLTCQGSFLKCNLEEFHQRHFQYVKRMFHAVETDDRWHLYRTQTGAVNDDEEEEEDGGGIEDQAEGEKDIESEDATVEAENNKETSGNEDAAENSTQEGVELRIYGELYGGGGISKDIKTAVQKEIIYTDEFRFYVFGININRKWTTLAEMNDLCQGAGFPYFATPVCPPKATIDELTNWLTESGFMKSRSRLTDKHDDVKTRLEGVVMTPLKRQDFRFHAIKFLAAAFNDVNTVGVGRNRKPDYCTKARYLSVLSKLDLHEREDAHLVVKMFIEDIIREGGESENNDSKKRAWTKCVRRWLADDGYIKNDGRYRNVPVRMCYKNSRNAVCSNTTTTPTSTTTEIIGDGYQEEFNDIGGLFE